MVRLNVFGCSLVISLRGVVAVYPFNQPDAADPSPIGGT